MTSRSLAGPTFDLVVIVGVHYIGKFGSGGLEFDSHRVRQHIFVEIDLEIYFYGHSLSSADSRSCPFLANECTQVLVIRLED